VVVGIVLVGIVLVDIDVEAAGDDDTDPAA
jgi:hypothetical protein